MKQYYSDRSNPQSTSILSDEISNDIWRGIYGLKEKYAENLAKNFPIKDDFFGNQGIVGFDEESFNDRLKSHKIDIQKKLSMSYEEEKISTSTMLDFIEFFHERLIDRNEEKDIINKWNDITKKFIAFRNNGKECQKKFRDEINFIFHRNNLIYQLNNKGEISKKVPEGFQDLPKSEIQCPDDQKRKIDEAVKGFYSKDSSVDTKRKACKELADVLEKIRKDLKKTAHLKEDEPNIFNLVNNFGIRHNNNIQKEMGDPIYWEWSFYMLLNTVITFYKLSHSNQQSISIM